MNSLTTILEEKQQTTVSLNFKAISNNSVPHK